VATKQDLMLPPIRQGGQSSDTYLLDVLVMACGTKRHEVRCLSDWNIQSFDSRDPVFHRQRLEKHLEQRQWVVFVGCRIQGAGVSREPDSRKALGKSMSIAASYSAVPRWVRCTKNISGFQVTCLFSRRLLGGGYRSLKLTLVFRTLHKQGSYDDLLQRSREIVSRL